jgi:hypothetical protein
MAACTASNHVFLGRPLFLLSSGIRSFSSKLLLILRNAGENSNCLHRCLSVW